LLVDAGTDFRSQALRHGLSRLDAVVLTHAHADHVLGLDDLRPLSWQKEIPIGVDEQTQGHVKRMFPYFFTETRSKSSRPQVTLTRLTPGEVITMAGFTLLPVSVWHGDDKILGFRTGDFAYLTDCNGIPDETWELLAGLEVLVLGVLRYKPHATHFHLELATKQPCDN
jgi:phosphoribosyl 1,2-cyclic phosphate phosphodiesterase